MLKVSRIGRTTVSEPRKMFALSQKDRERYEEVKHDPMPFPYECDYCQDGGRIRTESGPKPCPRCQVTRLITGPERIASSLRLAPIYRHTSFETYEARDEVTTKALALAQEWIALWPPEKPLVAFLANSGTGKTHLAISVLKSALKTHEIRGSFWTVAEVLDRFRATMHEDSLETIGEVTSYFQRVPLLVLDDYGKQADTAWVQERFFALLDYRYTHLMGTIITSEHTLDSLPPYLRSRLSDRDYSTVIILRGAEDYRPRR